MEIQSLKNENPEVFRKIWKIVFGDSDKWLDMYMKEYMDDEKAFVLKDEGAMQSILSYYEHRALLCADGMCYEKAPCFYAGSTLPGRRKRGYFTAIMEYVTEKIKEAGYENVSIFPAEEWLFDYYRERFDFKDFYYVNEINADSGDLMAWEYGMKEGRDLSLNVISASKYNSVREKILKGKSHLAFTDKQMKMQKETAMLSHGNLYEIKGMDEKSLCCIERLSSSKVKVTEILTGVADFKDAIALIRKNFHGAFYRISYPDFICVDTQNVSVARKCVGQIRNLTGGGLPESAYAGFMFD